DELRRPLGPGVLRQWGVGAVAPAIGQAKRAHAGRAVGFVHTENLAVRTGGAVVGEFDFQQGEFVSRCRLHLGYPSSAFTSPGNNAHTPAGPVAPSFSFKSRETSL